MRLIAVSLNYRVRLLWHRNDGSINPSYFCAFCKIADETHLPPNTEGKARRVRKSISRIRLMPEAKCNFRGANKKKAGRKPTLKILCEISAGKKRKSYAAGKKMFLAARDRNTRRNLSFRRFIRAHAKPPLLLGGVSLKLAQLKSRWAHASATLVLPSSRQTRASNTASTSVFQSWNYRRDLSVAHWLPLAIAIIVSIQSCPISSSASLAWGPR